MRQGSCQYGGTCKFAHPDKKEEVSTPAFIVAQLNGITTLGASVDHPDVPQQTEQDKLPREYGTFGGPLKWIADTGAGHDMVSPQDISPSRREAIRKTKSTVVVRTANGTCATAREEEVHCCALGQSLHPYIMEKTPIVVYRGKMHGTRLDLHLGAA